MTIEVITPPAPKVCRDVHPEWAAWFEASAYTHADARRELGLTNTGGNPRERSAAK